MQFSINAIKGGLNEVPLNRLTFWNVSKGTHLDMREVTGFDEAEHSLASLSILKYCSTTSLCPLADFMFPRTGLQADTW